MFNKKLLSFLIILCNSYLSFSQECDKLLQGGLYSFTSMTNTGSFSKDLRTYYLSTQFYSDLKSGKWGGSVTIPIDGIPFTLGMNYSESDSSTFRSKILQTSELKIKSDYYKTTFSSIPNTNLYQAYVDCIGIINDISKTGFIQGTNIETESTVVFTLYYRKQAATDAMPIVRSFNVEPTGSVISGNITVGQKLNSLSILVTCKRDPEKDLVLSLTTDRGSLASKSIAEGSFTSNSVIPIGTVITSLLKFEDFSAATKNNEKSPGGIWTSGKSKWAPCDGRPLPYSKYSKFASQNNAPDLRGLFLRGANSFDNTYTLPPQDITQLSTDPKSVGVYQSDALQSHQHKISNSKGVMRYIEGGPLLGGVNSAFLSVIDVLDKGNSELLKTDNDGGGSETTVKNVSIYYYIKIN